MHCPQCGFRIESEDISYCTRCGQMLERIRIAMSDEAMIARGTKVSRGGVNLGVGLMYVTVWPALAAVLLSPTALPAAFLILSVALIAIVFGSGPLLRRLFQPEELHPEVERARRKEIAFGSTLMYLGTILATLIVAVAVPDWYVRIALIGSITAVFGGLLAASKPLYKVYREPASNEPLGLEPATATRESSTASLDTDPLDLRIGAGSYLDAEPRTVTEGTTRTLDTNLTKTK